MLKRYRKIDLAERQLETALILFLDKQDIVSVITLAFAADDILSSVMAASPTDGHGARRKRNPLTRHPWLEENAFEGSSPQAANGRSAAKVEKLDTSTELEVPLDLQREAARILDYAVQSYWQVKGELTPRMILFKTMQEEL